MVLFPYQRKVFVKVNTKKLDKAMLKARSECPWAICISFKKMVFMFSKNWERNK